MKNKLITLGITLTAAAGIFSGFAVGGNIPQDPPGQDPCSHGNTGKPCRPDPQPNRGEDCLHHGKKGGVNEDHCTDTTTRTTTTAPTTAPATTTVTLTPGPPPSGQVVPQPLPSPTVKADVKANAKAKAKLKARILKSVVSHHRPKTTG